jgi:hypothetical protein
MDLLGIRNKLIVYKTYEKLPYDIVTEIEDVLLNKSKIEDFEKMLQKVEDLLVKKT